MHKPEKPSAIRRFFIAQEGFIFAMGLLAILIYNTVLIIDYYYFHQSFQAIIGMTGANLIFGRAAGLAFGFASELNVYVVILLNMLIETGTVLLLYPLVIMLWKNLLGKEYPYLSQFADYTRQMADTHKDRIKKYGPWGLFLFVFIPLWATGPLVGCAIGYLLGFSHRYTLLVVLGGTNFAILCWAILIKYMKEFLSSYGEESIWAAVVFFVLIGVYSIIRRIRAPRLEQREKNGHPAQKSE